MLAFSDSFLPPRAATDTTTGTNLHHKSNKIKSRTNPHERQHGLTQTRTNVQILRTRELISEDHEHDSRNYRARSRKQQ